MTKLIIEPGRAERNYWRDLWRYRELFYFLAWRDILVRYKQTVIGIAWAVIQPFLTTVVFTVVFNRIAKLSGPGRRALFPGGDGGATALAVFFHLIELLQQQPHRQREPDFQDLLSAPHRSRRLGHHQLRGFSHHGGAGGGDDGLVSIPAGLAVAGCCRCS